MKSFVKKRMLALLLAVVMAGSLCTGVEVFAQETEAEKEVPAEEVNWQSEEQPTSGSCGANARWSFDRANKVLTISGSGEMNDLDNESAPWGMYCREVKKVVIGNGITSIGDSSFEPEYEVNYPIESVTLPNSLTRIGSSAFYKCVNLKNITIPESVEYIGGWAFAGCESISSITLPEGLISLDMRAFIGCSNLRDITILSRQCWLVDQGDEPSISETATIYGYAGSTVEGYALRKNRRFVALEEPEITVPDESESTETKEPAKKNSIKKISISGPSHKIAAGKKVTLKAAVSPSNATNKAVTWKSSNTKYATVSSKGVVTMKKAGKGKTVTITATAKDGSGKKAVYKIKFMKGAVKKVAISGKSKRTVQAGKTVTLKAYVKTTVKSSKDVNKTLKWTTSNKKYATVTSKGKVKTLKAGKGKKVKITAAATDGSGKKATVTITLN